MQRFWSSFNNWITISLEKWPRTEEKKLIFIWHLNTDTCWSVVITAITRWVHSILYCCDIDKRVQWRRDRGWGLNSDTFPACSMTRPARAAFTRRKLLVVYIRCVTRVFLRLRLGMVRLNTAAHWSGITIYYYRSQHSHHSSLASPCSPSFYITGPREFPPRCKYLIQACTDSDWTSAEEKASIITWKLILSSFKLEGKEKTCNNLQLAVSSCVMIIL